MTDEFLKEYIREREEEHARRMKWAAEAARKFAGLSLEAVLLGFLEHAFCRWDDVVKTAKRAQLDIENAALRKRHDEVFRQSQAALKESAMAGKTMPELRRSQAAWKRYERLSAEQARIEAEQERIQKAREELGR